MSGVTVRRADAEDAAALALVGGATFLETFAGLVDGSDIVAHCAWQHAGSVYAAWLADARYALWLATVEPGGAPVGFAVLAPADMPIPDPRADDLEIRRIYLLSRFHGGGAGRALMDAALEEAQARKAGRVLIGVKDDNARAIAFYKKNGFAVVGARIFSVGTGTYSDLIFGRTL